MSDMFFLADNGPPSFSDTMDLLLFLVLFFGPQLIFYFIPTIVAWWIESPRFKLVLIVNFLFGVTGIGWMVAMIFAVLDIDKKDDTR